MELEIVDMTANKAYSSPDGFVIACGYSLNISALKTADGLYVAEREDFESQSYLVVTFETELEVMACVAMWIPEEHIDALKGVTFHGLTYRRRGFPAPKTLSDLVADSESYFTASLDIDMTTIPHLHGIPNTIGTVVGRMYDADTRRSPEQKPHRKIGEKQTIEIDFAEMEKRVMALNIEQGRSGV